MVFCLNRSKDVSLRCPHPISGGRGRSVRTVGLLDLVEGVPCPVITSTSGDPQKEKLSPKLSHSS